MRMTISRNDILSVMQRCQDIVERRTPTPILSSVLLSTSDDGLIAMATDLETAFRAHVPAMTQEPGRTAVSARKLFEVLKELPPDTTLELTAGGQFLHLQSGRSRFRLATLPPDDFPDVREETDGVIVRLNGADLATMIVSTSFAMSTDETRRYLTGTLFELTDDGYLNLVTTDGHRLALMRRRPEYITDSRHGIVPRKAVMEFRKLCESEPGPVELRMSERQISLIAGGSTLISKLIDARFPDYADVIPEHHPRCAVVGRIELDQILRRLMIVANEYTHDVRMLFRPGELLLSSRNSDAEQAEESMSVDYDGPETEIGFNARYIRDVLGVMPGDAARIWFHDGLSPVLMDQEDVPEARFVVMPMRI